MLTPGFNRWGQMPLHFGTSPKSHFAGWLERLPDGTVFDVDSTARTYPSVPVGRVGVSYCSQPRIFGHKSPMALGAIFVRLLGAHDGARRVSAADGWQSCPGLSCDRCGESLVTSAINTQLRSARNLLDIDAPLAAGCAGEVS